MNRSQYLAFGGLAVGAIFSPGALAVNLCNPAVPMSDWAAFGPAGCQEYGLIYTWLSNTPALDDATVLSTVNLDNPTPGYNTHKLNTSSWPDVMDFVYTLTYSVEMDLGVHPFGYFTGAQLTSDTSITSLPASATFTSEYYSSAAMDAGSLLGQVESLNSGGSLVTPVVYGLRKVWIRDTYEATGNAIVNSATDYLYLTVPEPSSLALFGVGLAGLAARRRLRIKARA